MACTSPPEPPQRPLPARMQPAAVAAQLPSCVQLLWTPRTHQAPLSMGFLRQEYWNGLSCPSPGDLPDPGLKSTFPALAGGFFTTEPPGKHTTKDLHLGSQLPSSCLQPPPATITPHAVPSDTQLGVTTQVQPDLRTLQKLSRTVPSHVPEHQSL